MSGLPEKPKLEQFDDDFENGCNTGERMMHDKFMEYLSKQDNKWILPARTPETTKKCDHQYVQGHNSGDDNVRCEYCGHSPEPTKAENGLVHELTETIIHSIRAFASYGIGANIFGDGVNNHHLQKAINSARELKSISIGTPYITKEQLLAILPEKHKHSINCTDNLTKEEKIIGCCGCGANAHNKCRYLIEKRIEELFKKEGKNAQQ